MRWEIVLGRSALILDRYNIVAAVEFGGDGMPYYYAKGESRGTELPHLKGRPEEEIKAALEGIIAMEYGE